MADENRQPDEDAFKAPDEPVCLPDGGDKLLQSYASLESDVGGDVAARKAYALELTEYVKVHRAELESLTSMRWWGAFFTYILILLLMGTFICVIFFETQVIKAFNDSAKTAFIVATVSGSVILMGIILRGVFGNRHRELLPGNLGQYVEAAKDVITDGK